MTVRFCDETGWGVGWVVDEAMERCSHALAHDGQVWLVDAVEADGVDERVRELGEPAGVIQLLDRHRRDCATIARRLEVPLHVTPFVHVPGSPFQPLRIVRTRLWTEIALWWPARRVLVCGDALGTAPYYRARGERLAVHPFLRMLPPQRLGGLEPAHVLCGHGEGVHERAAEALDEALASSGRRIPSWLVHQAWHGLRRAGRR